MYLERRINKPISEQAQFGSKRTALPGFPPPTTFPHAGSDQRRVYLTRLCYAFRLSQPLDVLFRLRPLGFVSRRIRPWGWSSQRFPPTSSRHDFRRALPLQLFVLSAGWSLRGTPKNNASTTSKITVSRRCSEEQRQTTAWRMCKEAFRRTRLWHSSGSKDAQGFMHLGGPFTAKRFYPTPAGRASLSLLFPSRISPLESRPR